MKIQLNKYIKIIINPIINPKKLNERIKNNNNIASILNNNLNQKYIKNNNREYQKKNNKRNEELYSYKRPTQIQYIYEPNKNRDKPVNNNIIINRVKNLNNKTYKIVKKNQGYNNYTNFLSPKKNIITNNSINKSNDKYSPYDTKKFINFKNNFSETKLFDNKRDIRSTYNKKNENKFISIDNGKKYNYYTSKKENYTKSKLVKENLKKGITTVIQHYLGIKERLDNYNLLQVPN